MTATTLILTFGFAFLVGVGVPFAFAIGLCVTLAILVNGIEPMLLPQTIIAGTQSFSLLAIPFFMLAGELMSAGGLSERLVRLADVLVRHLTGGLGHVTIVAALVFAAISGSAPATTAAIGAVMIPAMAERGYDRAYATALVVSAGVLAPLIPPSIAFVIWGVIAEQSIARLFIAGILPGIVLATMFTGYVVIWALRHPDRTPPAQPEMSLGARLHQSRRLLPIFLLIVGVIGSIYMGLASPTDAAAVGVVLALILSRLSGTLSWQTFVDGVMGATRTSCMIAFILLGAAYLTAAMGFAGIPNDLAVWMDSLDLSRYALITALTVFFIVLGCFLDGISIVVLTSAVILPMVERAGFDLVWFGIYLVVVVEMSSITRRLASICS
jgi:C4-dicarboxylate transporter, DctM subunit